MKYTVCYPAGHTRTIEFAGITWTPTVLVEFADYNDIPAEVLADSRFHVAEAAPTRRKSARKSVDDSPPEKPEA